MNEWKRVLRKLLLIERINTTEFNHIFFQNIGMKKILFNENN